MVEAPLEEPTEIKELMPSDRIVKDCLDFHHEFDRTVWGERASFHNERHVKATSVAADQLIKAMLSGYDPLGIMNSLKTWNGQHKRNQVKPGELTEAVKLAFACHDLGNIANDATTEETGKVSLSFLKGYKANGAEKRSQEIGEKLITASKMTDDMKTRLQPSILHLIDQTRFAPERKVPFAIFARVVDQIGNTLFNEDEEWVIGLLEEMCAEKPYAKLSPSFFYNFARERFSQLVPDAQARNSVLDIWGKKLPDKKTGLREELTTIADWLGKYQERPS